jgi:hypothetical protein
VILIAEKSGQKGLGQGLLDGYKLRVDNCKEFEDLKSIRAVT